MLYAPPAPPQQLPPSAEEGESTAGEGASGEGASCQGEGRVEDLDSESDLDMTEVWPPVPPSMCEAPAAEPGARAGECAAGNSPTPSVSLGRDDSGDINGSSGRNSSDDSQTRSSFPLLPKRGSLQRGRARVGRAPHVKARGGWKTWTASLTST